MDLEQALGALQAVGPEGLDLLDETQLAGCYERVRQQLDDKAYAEALDDAFRLVHSEPWERAYHLTLASCLQHLDQFESAARFYGLALLLDATDAHCAYRIGECLDALDHHDDAREAFESAIKLSWLDAAYAEVRRQAELRLAEMAA